MADINPVREKIDALDTQLLDLLVARSALAKDVAAAKAASGDTGFGWRVAREVAILRRLLAHAPQLKPALIIQVWRSIIAANLAEQSPYDVYAMPESLGYAEVFFGVATIARALPDAEAIFSHLAQTPTSIAVMPLPANGHDWWALLDDPRFSALHVRAACFDGTDPSIIRALNLSALPPEPSGKDRSLLSLDADFARAAGLNIIRVVRARALIEVDGAIEAHEKDWAIWRKSANARLIGIYGII